MIAAQHASCSRLILALSAQARHGRAHPSLLLVQQTCMHIQGQTSSTRLACLRHAHVACRWWRAPPWGRIRRSLKAWSCWQGMCLPTRWPPTSRRCTSPCCRSAWHAALRRAAPVFMRRLLSAHAAGHACSGSRQTQATCTHICA